MARVKVKGPNGVVNELDEQLAAALIGDGKRGYELVGDEPKRRSKSASRPANKSEKSAE